MSCRVLFEYFEKAIPVGFGIRSLDPDHPRARSYPLARGCARLGATRPNSRKGAILIGVA